MDFKYPYTDYHELNLDWFLSEFKNLTETWARTQQDWISMQQYIRDYFDNLNVQTEIDNKIEVMIQDGTFGAIVEPFVTAALPAMVAGQLPDVVATQIGAVVAAQIDAVVAGQLPAVAAAAAAAEVGAWLAAHIDPDTGYVIDKSLTVSDAAADAKITGEAVKLSDYIINSIKNRLIKNAGVNLMPQLSEDDWTSGYKIDNTGNAVSDANSAYTKLIEVEPFTTYGCYIIPAYGTANYPWWTNTADAVVCYDVDGNFVKSLTPGSGIFTTDGTTRYIRINVASNGITRATYNARCMLVKGSSVPGSYSAYDPDEYYDIAQMASDMAMIYSHTYIWSTNRYDASLQTPDTISPHFWYDGAQYPAPTYDEAYNCTAEFDIEPSTQYTIGLVPAFNGITKPWNESIQGIFFYDENHTYISRNANNTFTTPANARYARFNYNLGGHITLDILNSRCVMVKDSTLPDIYIPFTGDMWVNEKITEVESVFLENMIRYNVDSDGISVANRYGDDELSFKVSKRGPNNLPDINTIHRGSTVLYGSSTDWMGPYVVRAINNIDGDHPDSGYFTGGNHNYNNTGTMDSTATGRCTQMDIYADGKLLTSGDKGYASKIMVIWYNNIQAYNTSKADGTGREVLTEKHTLVYDGKDINIEVEIIPLEDIEIITWYGFQASLSNAWQNVTFIGAVNRQPFNVSDALGSGNRLANGAICQDSDNIMQMTIDRTYDVGKGDFAQSIINGIFTSNSKLYSFLIKNKEMDEDDCYFARGTYSFISK